ncbi:type IV toxin-antitoxin system AbiEi family antitoxin domain-containing protein [Pseudonocardia nantongensis]|uniref:type IV toxin-antitoxin system AbiEi family antitoxin domain-containing protein n=1 Tax=Pseudonocardia nantongensis TaxID=1181885 RepID=UPI00397E022D
MTLDAVVGPGPFRRADLHAAGLADSAIRGALRSGELQQVCRGMYVTGRPPTGPARSFAEYVEQQAARHVLAVHGVLARLGVPAVVSHASAAVLHGLAIWDLPIDQVHLTRARPTGARRGRDLRLHAAPLPDEEVTVVRGVPVTAPARTVVDIARSTSFARAVVVADSAQRTLAATPAGLRSALRGAAGRAGVGNAVPVVEFADGRSASPGESRSRVLLHRSGIPAPELQHEVTGRDGNHLATVDFWWGGRHPVVGEFDGEIKYGRLLRPGQEPGDVVVQEKIREDLLRDLGLQVVRWTWQDLAEPAWLLERLRHRLARRHG